MGQSLVAIDSRNGTLRNSAKSDTTTFAAPTAQAAPVAVCLSAEYQGRFIGYRSTREGRGDQCLSIGV